GIGAELDLVDCEELDRAVERHRFNRADEIGRVRREDLLLPGDQRDRARAAQLDDPVVIFPRQEPQREADHAALMIEHPLDRVVSLAGIGRSEDRDEARRGTEHGHATWYRVETVLGQEQIGAKKARWPAADRVPARDNQIFTIMPLIPKLCSARLR